MNTLDTAVKFFRRHQDAQMRAQCTVTRRTADGAFNESTGEIGDPTETTVYSGKCNAREAPWEGTGFGMDATSGQREVRFGSVQFRFPHDTDVRKDDVVTITAATHDTPQAGQEYRITDVFLDSWQTVRRAVGEKVS